LLCQREFSFIFGTPATICVTSGVRHVSEVGSNELKGTKARFQARAAKNDEFWRRTRH
jgi:hypothetical protein